MADIDPHEPSASPDSAPRTPTRRDFLLLLSGAAVLGMGGLTGCDDDPTGSSSSSSGSSSSSSSSSGA